MMIDCNFELNLQIHGIVERLEKSIPFKKIDIEHLQLDSKDDKNDNCPEGTMRDINYNYCYRNLLIETKEWYTILQSLSTYLSGKMIPEKSKQAAKKATPKDKNAVQEKDKDTPQPRCVELKQTVDQKTKLQSYQVLNFSSEANMAEFMVFLAEYMAFTEKQVHLTILIGDMVEQAIRYSNIEQYHKNIKNDQEIEKLQEADKNKKQEECCSHPEETESPSPLKQQQETFAERVEKRQKKNSNLTYKFMSIDQLEHFKESYFKCIGQLTLRMYKSVYALYKLYPNFNVFENLSIFDKVYQLQMISHSFSQYQTNNLQELQRLQLPQLFDFEHQAQLLLKDGGIKNKDLEIIQDVSRVIRDQIDVKLEYAQNTYQISADFFISSKDFSEVWNGSIINDYQKTEKFKFKVGIDVIKMAYQKHLGGNNNGVLTDESFNLFKGFLAVDTEPLTNYQTVKMVDLINFTDFIEFHTILNVYCQDQVGTCLEQIKGEKSIIQDLYNQNLSNQKIQSSGGFVAAGSSKLCFDPEGQAQNLNAIDAMLKEQNSSLLDKNVFIRTPKSLEHGDWDLLYFLNLFGFQQILNKEMQYALYMKERLEAELLRACEINDSAAVERYKKQIDLIERKTMDYAKEFPQPEKQAEKEREETAATPEDEQERNPILVVSSEGALPDSSVSPTFSPPSGGANSAIPKPNPNILNKNMTIVPSKKVQIMSSGDSPDHIPAKRSHTLQFKKMANKKNVTTVKVNPEPGFMRGLDYEGCHLMGLDSILQVNEVYENFADATALQTSLDDDGFNNTVRQPTKGKHGSTCFLDVLDAHPELQLASYHDELTVKRHNNIQDVMTRTLQNKRKRIENQLQNQIGETFGNHDKIEKDEEYEGFNKLNKGYLLQFKCANEAKFLSQNYIFQKIIQGSHFLTMEPGEPISTTYRLNPSYPERPPPNDKYDEWGFQKHTDKSKAYLPVCIPFKKLLTKSGKNEHIRNQKILEYYIFRDFNTILQRNKINRIIRNPMDFNQSLIQPPPDLNVLKKYILRCQKLHFYKRKEMHQRVQQLKVRQIVGKRFYDIFTKLSAISTDGFQREQHVIKIQHWTDEVTKAQLDLQREEQLVESGSLMTQDAQNLSESIQRITTLMINIERWTAQKLQMEETLKAEEQDWIQNDTIYKQRRIILNYIIKLNLDMVYDTHAYLYLSYLEECNRNLSGQAYELIFFMIQHILCQNRMPSINFMAEINQFINSQQEEMIQLNNTQFELTSKVLAIEEEKREMRKKIDEMKQVCDLKEAKETLLADINNLDTRVAQLKKMLGKGPASMPEIKEKV